MRVKRPHNNVNCKNGNTRFIEDEFNTEICNDCDEIVSYEKHDVEDKTKVVKTRKHKPRKDKGLEMDFDNPIEEVKPKKERKKKRIIEVDHVYVEDCFTTMQDMKTKQVDYIFTSPPYNIGNAIGGQKYKDESDNLDQQGYMDWQIKLIDEMIRVTKHHIFYNIQMLSGNKIALLTLMEHYKYQIKDIFIWNKKRCPPASCKGVTNSKYEYIIVFSNKKPEDRNFPDGNFHGDWPNVIEVDHEHNKYAKEHKAIFPISFPRLFMSKFGKEGDVWYDPFGGTGTTAAAALETDRHYILSELSESYARKFIAPRLKAYHEQLKMELK